MVDVSDLLGIRYKEHGRTKDGYDCYGLVIEVMRRYGIEMPDFEYDRHTDTFINDNVNETMRKFSKNIRKADDFCDGAIVLFGNEAKMNTHIGVYVGDGYIIHCDRKGVRQSSVMEFEGIITGIYIWQK